MAKPSKPSESEFQPQVQSQEDRPSDRPSPTQSIAPPPAEPQTYQPKRKVCNPCGCWCCTCCNLRVSLMVNAAITIAFFGYVLFISIIGARCCEFIAAVLVLIACFRRSGVCAIAGATFYCIETIFISTGTWANYKFFDSWPGLVTDSEYSEYGIEYNNEVERTRATKSWALTGGIVAICTCIYFAICCFQFRAQIKLGVDLAPHVPHSCKEDPQGTPPNQQMRPTAPPANYSPSVQPSYVNPYPAYPPPQYGAYQGPPQYTTGPPSQYGYYPPPQYNAYPPPQYNYPPPPQYNAYPPPQYNYPPPSPNPPPAPPK